MIKLKYYYLSTKGAQECDKYVFTLVKYNLGKLNKQIF